MRPLGQEDDCEQLSKPGVVWLASEITLRPFMGSWLILLFSSVEEMEPLSVVVS